MDSLQRNCLSYKSTDLSLRSTSTVWYVFQYGEHLMKYKGQFSVCSLISFAIDLYQQYVNIKVMWCAE
jgi:hypothetical protein